MQELGPTLKQARLAARMTLRQVSAKIGLSPPYLSQLENGICTNPSAHILHKLAQLFSIDVTIFYKLAVNSTPNSSSNEKPARFLGDTLIDPAEELLLNHYLQFLRFTQKNKWAKIETTPKKG